VAGDLTGDGGLYGGGFAEMSTDRCRDRLRSGMTVKINKWVPTGDVSGYGGGMADRNG